MPYYLQHFYIKPLCCQLVLHLGIYPYFLGSQSQEEYQATLRKGAAFTFGFLLRYTAAHWTFHFGFLQNSLVSQHQTTVKGQVSVFACEASGH